MHELKKCPFCGTDVEIEIEDNKHYHGTHMYVIKCKSCGIPYISSYDVYISANEALKELINRWNTRSYE